MCAEWVLDNSECLLNKFWRSSKRVLIDTCMTHERLSLWVLNKFCKITPGWLLNDSCMTNEYLLNEFWRSSGRALRDTWVTPEWLVDESCTCSEGVLSDSWMPSESVLKEFRMRSERFSMSSERVLNDLWINSEWVENGTSTAAEWVPMSFIDKFRSSCEWAQTWMRQSLQEFSMAPQTSC